MFSFVNNITDDMPNVSGDFCVYTSGIFTPDIILASLEHVREACPFFCDRLLTLGSLVLPSTLRSERGEVRTNWQVNLPSNFSECKQYGSLGSKLISDILLVPGYIWITMPPLLWMQKFRRQSQLQ